MYLTRAARHRRLHVARGVEDFLAGALRRRREATTRRWGASPASPLTSLRSNRTTCWTSTTSSTADRIRMMVMEWVDGYDLRRPAGPGDAGPRRDRVSSRRWEYINRVIVTAGPTQPRFKPGVAVAIVRDCLAALAALHREGIVHGDIKPSNIMLKRTGNAKIVDIGSAFEMDDSAAAADLHAGLRRSGSAGRQRVHAAQRLGVAWVTC